MLIAPEEKKWSKMGWGTVVGKKSAAVEILQQLSKLQLLVV